ncbi:DUF5057 domain-containing protein [Paenibacillus whitsoniae]|uniref:DUF5057 domain-containing protein n=1 Tax=Paenibacillus whitsoniae TaxID=2496558 RepID=A0A430J468_9BACL|nr:DUF5057 domain-containing protein [Paenibacillus whitsoniae]RTE01417.1 DUF5057 domain-containing protein [Paenibacillus whitsoniae]
MLSSAFKKISMVLIVTLLASLFSLAGTPLTPRALAASGDSVTVALKASNGKYVSAGQDGGSSLKANADDPWFGELFDLIEQSDGKYALKSRASGNYVSVDSSKNNPLKANSSSVADNQKFTMSSNADGTVSFQSMVTGYGYVTAPNDSTSMSPSSSSITDKEKFALTYFDLTKPLKILEIKDLDKPSSGDTDTIVSDLKNLLGTNSNLKLETISIKTFVALRDELDGKYDAIYFGKSLFNPTSETGNNHNTRYKENDITQLKATEIKDKYITKGLPVIYYNDNSAKRGPIYQGYLNNGTWNQSKGNLYNLFNTYVSSPVSNVIAVNQTQINSLSAFLGQTHLLTAANVRPQLNLTGQPTDYSASANRSSSFSPGDTLTYTFNVSNVRNLEQRNLVANLYLGIDSVLKFQASNLVQSKAVTSLKNNTISFTLPKGYSGLYYWRLELVDTTSTGKLKDAVSGVFRFKDQPPTINVLQVLPNSTNSKSSLKDSANMNQSYLNTNDYKINITVMDFTTFNSTEYSQLNSKYDMVIFGFNDSYNGTANISETAAAAVQAYIGTGQGVMFTHDTVYQGNQTWIKYFQTATGQLSPMTNMGLNAPNTSTSTVKVNEGLLTQFPFYISEMTPQVATTHDQYFRLDLNDPTIIPWYNINGSPRDVQDSWNHYYTYSKGNVTYSGTGHNFVNSTRNSAFPEWEQQLFVNTMYRAFIGSNHKPTLDILSPAPFDNTSKNYISANSPISVTFKPDDLDLNDKKVISNVKFTYTDSAGHSKTDTMLADTETNKGETITRSFTNPLAASGGDLTITVTTRDSSGAMETKSVAVKVITSTTLTPERTISTEKIEVGQPVTVNYTIKPLAKPYSAATNVDDLKITGLHFKEVLPANLEIVSKPNTLTATGSLATGFTLEGDITDIPYRRDGNQFVADNTTFNVVVKPKNSGDYSLSNANLTYKDYATNTNQNVLFSNKVFTAFVKATNLTLDNVTIAKGDTTKLIPKILPVNATYQRNEDFTWASDTPATVTVNASGEITGLNAGTATVTATAKDGSGLVATAIVSVIQPGLNITGPTQVAVGSTIDLTAALVSVNENVTSVSWTSSKPAVANFTVDNKIKGTLSGNQKGTVTVTVSVTTDKGRSYSKDYNVSVFIPISSVSISDKVIRVGENVKLTPSYSPSNADYPNFTWTSSRNDVASISDSGVLTGKAAGETTLTVRATDGSNVSGTAKVTVMQPSLTISGPTSVYVGDSITLAATLQTVNETIASVTWEPDNRDKADWKTDGDMKRIVTGTAAGTVNVPLTVTTNAGSTYTAIFSFTVKPVLTQSIGLSNKTIRVNEDYSPIVTFTPANVTNKALSWSTNNSNVLTIDSTTGTVKGKSVGSATISAITMDGTNKSASATITVMQPKLSISHPSNLLRVGSELELKLNFTTVNEEIATTSWKPGNNEYARWRTNEAESNDIRYITGLSPGDIPLSVSLVSTKGNTYEATSKVTVFSLDLPDTTIDINEKKQLAPLILPANIIPNDFTWSSNSSHVTVDQAGNIEAISVGEAQITIVAKSDPTLTATGTVKVIQPGVSLVLNGSAGVDAPTSLLVGDKIEIKASFESTNQSVKHVKWDIDDPNGAISPLDPNSTDDFNKEFTGLKVGVVHGTITITTDKDKTYNASFTINVTNPVRSVDITAEHDSINVGDSTKLTAVIERPDAVHDGFQWFIVEEGTTGTGEFSNQSGATISLKGKQRGKVIVRVLVGGKSKEKEITVNQSITGLFLPEGPITLVLDGNPDSTNLWTPLVIVPSLLKDEVRDELQWTVSDPNVVTFDKETGVATGEKVGTAVITVSDPNNSSISDSVTINVISQKTYNNRY